MRKKLLIMASLFYPQKNGGGPPVSIMNIVKSISNEFDIYIISKNYEFNGKERLMGVKDGWNTFSFGKVFYFPYGEYTIDNVYKLICEMNPDLIYQNSFFSYVDVIPVLRFKKKTSSRVKVIIAPRGELCENTFKMKRLKKQAYVYFVKMFFGLGDVYFHATGEDEKNGVLRTVGVKDNKIYDIQNISYVKEEGCKALKKNEGELKLVFVARVSPKKNLLYAISLLGNLKGKISYDIYGSLEDSEYYSECKKEIEKLPKNVSVNYCGQLEQDKVSDMMKNYHCFFMPTLSENYGHSIIEALLSYRPVIISDQTPWKDLEEKNAGYAIPLEDKEKYIDALNKMVNMNNDEFYNKCLSSREYVRIKLDNSKLVSDYIDMFKK